MAPEKRLITVAIHTGDKALALKSLLESEGVHVTLQNVNLEQPVVSAGMRVRISEEDLPLALRIIENREFFLYPESNGEASSGGLAVLVPVDFSSHSERALTLAFDIAASHGASVIVLHSYMVPYANTPLQISDALTFDGLSGEDPVAQTESAAMIQSEATAMMEQLRRRLRESIKRGELPAVKFTTMVTEGVPEESIDRVVKEKNPWCLVMGTRAAHQKERELVGSVSAEVLDTCRIQAVTVPEGASLERMDQVRHVTLLSTFSQEDFLALDAIHRLLPPGQPVTVTVVSIPSRRFSRDTERTAAAALKDYCSSHYPNYTFELRTPDRSEILEEYTRIERLHHIDLMVVPNRKKNIFARLFNPGIAHRVLFHFDIPMMVVPV